MNKCKTCKHWKHAWGKRFCSELGQVPADEMGDSDATIECLHDSLIYTGPEFGCVHWEETE